jgi:hypothetical protein
MYQSLEFTLLLRHTLLKCVNMLLLFKKLSVLCQTFILSSYIMSRVVVSDLKSIICLWDVLHHIDDF